MTKKVKVFTLALSLGFALGGTSARANQAASQNYKLRVTNGSAMPVSPAAIYVKFGRAPLTQIGNAPTTGFTRLCQTGNPDQRLMEIQRSASVEWSQKTSGLLMPGQSIEVEIPVRNGYRSIHFEAMYGKTKDACAVFNVTARELSTMVGGEILVGRDEVLASGSFTDPMIPKDTTGLCANTASAVDCLRDLAHPVANEAKVRFFPGYLPSVLNFLEDRYGSADTQSLSIPTSGALRFEVIK